MTKRFALALMLLVTCISVARADQTIDQLGAAAPASDSDLIAVESGGMPPAKQMTLGALRAYITTVATPAFYVASLSASPAGSDTNAGTLAAPFATVQKCQAAMQQGTIKICYIRAGTYTGAGVGYTTQTVNSGAISVIASLTSSDSGETFSYYPPDGYNTAVFDGGAGTWSAPAGAASGCVTNASPTVARGWGFYLNATSNAVINGLTFKNFCYGAIGIIGDGSITSACLVGSGNAASGNTIENNIVSNISNATAQCNGDFTGGENAIEVNGNVQNTTISHNYIFNATNGAIGVQNQSLIGNYSNLVVDHNLTVNTGTDFIDHGSIYVQDIGTNCNPACSHSEVSTNVKIQYNYVMSWGLDGDGGCGGVVGGCEQAYYNDDGASNTARVGNVALGPGNACFFQHAGTNNSNSGNICDLGNRATAVASSSNSGQAWYWVNSGNVTSGTGSHSHDIVIANTASCFPGSGTVCALQQNDGTATITIGNNDYWNYNAAGNTILNTSATQNSDASPNNVDAFGNTTTRCPGGNLDSWGYVIPVGNSVFSAPVTFPAQPTGWATPGFWGPPVGPNWNGKIPHSIGSFTATAPSYGPTC